MIYKNYGQLIEKIKKLKSKKRVAVVAAEDEHALEAVFAAQKDNTVYPILVGKGVKIRSLITKLGENPEKCTIVDVTAEQDPARAAVDLLNRGGADFLMKGKIDTAGLLKTVVDKKNGLCTGMLMSHLAFFEIPNYHKLLALTDGGMVTYPDLEQKKQLIINAVRTLNSMGYEKPKIAVLCAIEQENPKMQETVDAAKLKEMNQKGEIEGCIIEGPISYDLMMSKESACIKGYDSPYCGDFDMVVVPNIVTGNALGKCLLYSAGAKMAGMIVGARIPIVLTSRGSTAEEKYLSLVLSASATGDC